MFLFLPDVIVLGDLIFWGLLIGFVFLEVILTSFRRFGWSTTILIGYCTGMYFLLGETIRNFFVHHWQTALWIAAFYVVGGFLWSIFKWFWFTNRRSTVFGEVKDKFYEKYKIPPETLLKDIEAISEKRQNENRSTRDTSKPTYWDAFHLSTFWDMLTEDERWQVGRNERFNDIKDFIPSAKKNKARIVGWMIWCVFDIVGTFLNDFIHDLFDALFTWAQSMLQLIANRNFKKHAKDLG
jgi:hypothetical protein